MKLGRASITVLFVYNRLGYPVRYKAYRGYRC